MKQSHLSRASGLPHHVAIIMDGNGRWAELQNKPRRAGHESGAKVAESIIELSAEIGIGVLTLYAFSSDNWKRPRAEVKNLMNLAERFFRNEAGRCREKGVRISAIGNRDRLPLGVRAAVAAAERITRGGNRLHARIALDYSSKTAIFNAARQMDHQRADITTLDRLIGGTDRDGIAIPSVDLLIRTGGEKRLSDFLLWEAAYAELYFSNALWPDFGPESYHLALEDYAHRQRRFGEIASGDERTA